MGFPCPSCGKLINIPRTPLPVRTLVYVSCLGALILLVGIGSIYSIANPPNSRGKLFERSKAIVTAHLRAPITAKFCTAEQCEMARVKNGNVLISGYVDSQNAFGAMIRSTWALEFQGKEKPKPVNAWIGEDKVTLD